MVTLASGQVSGNYTARTLQDFYEQVGFSPLDLPPPARPVITLKRQTAGNVAVPQILTTAAADAVKLGCWLHVQEVDHNPQHPGPDAGETEAEWMRQDLVSSIAALDAWLDTIQADRRRVYVSYGNEFDLAADPVTGVPFVWNGQPGSLDPNGEWFHREAAFMESVALRLDCLPAFGNDASVVGLLRLLPARLAVYGEWGVTPAALAFHGYGFGGHHAHQIGLVRQTARASGFKGLIIGGELSRRVDASAGNAADRALSGEWWKQNAFEAAKFSDWANCFFHLYEATGVPEILAAFKSPVPTGASSGVDQEEASSQAWGIRTALLPAEEREADLAGAVAGRRAARETR
jgi:hypothetical protein